ncbi:hypothetical protein CMK19_06335 [Candidatus Poribacteria bacterium]|nr:hypothetical protein [Candidatus Poribacteria bacterium]|tara:strand:+ start:523 stop:1119 length:597 start_codon:yes stop_codon:yes gene_type:complete
MSAMNQAIRSKTVFFFTFFFFVLILSSIFSYGVYSTKTSEINQQFQPVSKEYQSISFDILADYDFGTLDWSGGSQSNQFITNQIEQIIPQSIKALDNQLVSVIGFVLPVETDGERIDSFLLLRDLQMCCYGTLPELNEWVYVEVPDHLEAKNLISDTPIKVWGTLQVEPRFKDDFLLSIYSLTFSDADALLNENESEE